MDNIQNQSVAKMDKAKKGVDKMDKMDKPNPQLKYYYQTLFYYGIVIFSVSKKIFVS